jgi:hypothetical protein
MFLLEFNSKQHHSGGEGYHWTALSGYQMETELQTITYEIIDAISLPISVMWKQRGFLHKLFFAE